MCFFSLPGRGKPYSVVRGTTGLAFQGTVPRTVRLCANLQSLEPAGITTEQAVLDFMPSRFLAGWAFLGWSGGSLSQIPLDVSQSRPDFLFVVPVGEDGTGRVHTEQEKAPGSLLNRGSMRDA